MTDQDQWDAYLDVVHKSIVDSFVQASDKVLVDNFSSATAKKQLTQIVLDKDALWGMIEDWLCNSQSQEAIDIRTKAGTMWADMYCEKQAIYDGKANDNDDI